MSTYADVELELGLDSDVNGEPATPEDRRDHGIARAAAKWTRILV